MARDRSYRSEVVATRDTDRSLTASGVNLSNKVGDRTKQLKVDDPEWMHRIWHFYDVIGEFRYACDWVGNLTSRARLTIMKDGAVVTDTNITQVMDMFFGGEDGQDQLLRELGVHMTATGDAYLLGLPGKKPGDPDRWSVRTPAEIKRTVFGQFDIDDEKYAKGNVWLNRIWRPHPRKHKEANSPSRAVMPILGELETLTMRVAAQIDSRLTGNGILLLPDEVSFPTAPTTTEAGTADEKVAVQQNTSDAISQLLVKIASVAIQEPSSAAAMVPHVFQMPGEFIQYVKHVTFSSDLDKQAPALRKEAISRIGLGMDMPPEVLLGTADMNHWSSWQMEEAQIKAHIEPMLAMIADSITTAYLWDALQKIAHLSSEEAHLYTIGVDTSELRMRPNRSKEAAELFQMGELKAATMRKESGFSEEDAPDEKERQLAIVRKVAGGTTTPEGVEAALRYLGVILDIRPPVEQGDVTEGTPRNPSLRDHPVREIPQTQDGPSEAAVAAAEVMVYRALERAGNKLKVKFKGQVPTDVAACDLYQYVTVDVGDMDDLLVDAWAIADRVDYGVDQSALDSYARMLFASRKPGSRDLLQSYLALRSTASEGTAA